jgi:hypothetical protein
MATAERARPLTPSQPTDFLRVQKNDMKLSARLEHSVDALAADDIQHGERRAGRPYCAALKLGKM